MLRILVALTAAAFIGGTAAGVDCFLAQSRSADQTAAEGDIVYRMLGELREIVSASFVLKADEYYHGGTRHAAGEHAGCLPGSSESDAVDATEHAHHHDQRARAFAAHRDDLWSRINREIYERPVHHLAGARQAEALPWFYLATRVDPHNVQAYVLGGYWLSVPLGKQEEATMFLREGLRHNPRSWEIYSQLGDVYFIGQRDYERAREAFSRAYALLPADAPQSELRHLLTLLTAACERTGKREDAAAYRRRRDELFPGLDKTTLPAAERRHAPAAGG